MKIIKEQLEELRFVFQGGVYYYKIDDRCHLIVNSFQGDKIDEVFYECAESKTNEYENVLLERINSIEQISLLIKVFNYKEMKTQTYLFYRKEGFYPLELLNNEDAIANAKYNKGTIKVTDKDDNIIWEE